MRENERSRAELDATVFAHQLYKMRETDRAFTVSMRLPSQPWAFYMRETRQVT
jgi:hypothetical protein